MDYVTIEKKNHAAVLTVTREKALNALSIAVLADLRTAMDMLSDIDDIWCLIITGAGEKAFVAGADIREMSEMTPMEARAFAMDANELFYAIENFAHPVIAAVNGYALGGGCELALCCDIRIASKNAVFAQPETGLGITPGFGGTQRLSRVIGLPMAKELIFTGRRISANEALGMGLVSRVCESSTLMSAAMDLASEICACAPIAVSLAKEAIERGSDTDLRSGLSMEAASFAQCFATDDQKNAMRAFCNKEERQPFKNG